MDKKLKIALIGGDLRQAALGRMLMDDGHDVKVCGLGDDDLSENAVGISGLKDREIVMLPAVPFTQDKMVSTPRSSNSIAMADLFDALGMDTLLIAGSLNANVRNYAGDRGIKCVSYLDRDDFSICNAALTADAALMVAMSETGQTMAFKKCLVSGFGRIGKLLSLRLRGLGAEVSASARRNNDLAWIYAFGFSGLTTSNWHGRLGEFDLIFNTVPAAIFSEEDAASVSPAAKYIELASNPGGLAGRAGEILGDRRVIALSLPGKFFPECAANILYQTLFRIHNEMEEIK